MLFWESCRNSLLFAVVLLVVGCSSVTNLNKTAESGEETGVQYDPDTLPTDDSPYARSPKRQVGAGFSFDIFGRNKKEASAGSLPITDDPEYAEYLEWKRWQEFKAYQAWKAKKESQAQGS
jgi:hypothetical protein